MQISLPGELERFVEEKVNEGDYASASEVVCEALNLWRHQATLTPENTEELRREIAVGVEQLDRGESTPLDMEAIKAEARRRRTATQR